MAFVFGDENSPNPNPRTIKTIMIYSKLVLLLRNIKKNRLIVVTVIPIEAINPGENLSDNLPAIGDVTAMTTGCATRISPADWGLKPLMYCR